MSTTAAYSGPINLCFGWKEGQYANENGIRLQHLEGNRWVDITTSRNTDANIVCGTASSLSPFILTEPAFTFNGFYPPVDNPPVVNTAKAGSAIPLKFGLGGFVGFSIFANGSLPSSQQVSCTSGSSMSAIEEIAAAGSSSLSYDSATGTYVYVWKSEKSWAGTCRNLVVHLSDGTMRSASFLFSK